MQFFSSCRLHTCGSDVNCRTVQTGAVQTRWFRQLWKRTWFLLTWFKGMFLRNGSRVYIRVMWRCVGVKTTWKADTSQCKNISVAQYKSLQVAQKENTSTVWATIKILWSVIQTESVGAGIKKLNQLHVHNIGPVNLENTQRQAQIQDWLD